MPTLRRKDLNYPDVWDDGNVPKFQTYDYPIGGKMVVGRSILSPDFRAMIEDGDREAKHKLKKTMTEQLVDYILEQNLIEFTAQDNHMTGDRSIAVRVYLAPNDQIRILRVTNKI